jgi:hypothetical protein
VPKGCKIRIIDCCQRNNEKLKETLSNANSFEGKGLTVEQKNRSIYVSGKQIIV